MKRIYSLLLAFLLTGSVFFFGGWAGKVCDGVTVNGVDVGGMSYFEAERAVRKQIGETLPPLIVQTPMGKEDFTRSLSFTDDVSSLVRRAKRGQTLKATVTRTWATAEEELADLCARCALPAQDARFSFGKEGFVYRTEIAGRACDYGKLLRDCLSALKEGKSSVSLSCSSYAPSVTEQSLRARTRKLSSFTTRFSEGNIPRTHNIALAAERIGGTVVEAGGEFSFNRTVGARTRENGFREAAVILNGAFVPGVGGGVCQASTTLFCAALRAGMKVTESRAHSLSVSYVPPSMDAMVSSSSDLRFVNPYEFPVYLLARVKGGSVTFEIYGAPSGLRFETESRILGHVAPPAEEIVEGERDEVLRVAKDGIVSESYLLTYDRSGNLLSRVRIRTNSECASVLPQE